MRHRHHASLLAVALLLAACEAPSTAPVVTPDRPTVGVSPAPVTAAGGDPREVLAQSPSPAATAKPRRLAASFSDVPLGTAPVDWVDVATEGAVPTWVYAGNWRVVEEAGGNRVFKHDDVREQPAVSFQRYRGDALGTANGLMPSRYYAEVAMRPIASPHNYPPTGDQGVQFYYLDPKHYVETIIKPTDIEVWEATAAEPNTSKGWKRIWGQKLQTKAGDVRRIGAEIDVAAGTYTAYLDGKALTTVKSDLIKPQAAWLALRGIGNVVSFDDVVIEPR